MSTTTRILIVDDNENNRYTLKRRLIRLDYDNVVEAEDGYQALELLSNQNFDIVLLDVMMPGMDGFEVLQKIKSTPKLANISVIMISALDDIQNVIKGIEMGADDFLPKPFNPTLLKARLIAAVRKRRLVTIETSFYKDFDKDTNFAKSELFSGSLDNEMSNNLDTTYVLLYIRFAHFNFINQSVGPEGASDYVKQQALRIATTCNSPDTTIGRLTDDVIVIFDTVKNLTNLVENIESLNTLYAPLKRSITIENQVFEGGIGIGISMAKARDKKPKSLISNAAFASQTALDNDIGIAFYDPELHQSNLDKFQLEPKLKEAIKNRDLTLFYQPIVNSQSGEIETFEALIRWAQADGSFIPPYKFIPLAEETGLILDIDSFVIDQTCRQIAHWIEKYGPDKNFSIGVNISAKHWLNPILVKEVGTALQKYNVPARYLKLEMTESAIIDDANSVKKIITLLKSMGIKIALDDFGTGYSSLGYLIEFPVDILKVDKIFVDAVHTEEKRKRLMSHILDIANSLGMKSIVEGVEHPEQVHILQQLSCDQIQGYYFYKPMPPAAIEKIFK